jgi:phosphate-selective porin OprO/OprP
MKALCPSRRIRSGLWIALLSLAAVARAQESSNSATSAGSQAGPRTNSSSASLPGTPDFAAHAVLIQKLLNRVEQLEKSASEQADQAKAIQKAHEESEQKLLGEVQALQNKIQALEAGRVLPEIALPADEAPTVQELDQKLRIADRKNELAAEAAEARAQELPKLSIGEKGFSFSSADTNFALRIRGVLQVDSRTFLDDNKLLQGNDSFLLRRARPIIEGTVFRDFDFQFVPDFGGSSVQIFDANLNYRLRPELQLRAGKFKGPVGLEQLQADANLSFNERSVATDLVPTRNVGVQLWGDIAGGTLSYAAGVFNGTGDSRNSGTADFSDDKEFAGRIFLQPFKQTSLTALQGLGFGLGASYSQVSSNALALPNITGGTLPGYTTDGQQQFFAYNPLFGPVVADGPHWRLSPQASYLEGPFGLLGEYVISHQGVLNSATLARAELEHTAWQVSAQWVLTGEPASFTGITPQRPFSLSSRGWGAWQLVARFGQLNLDEATFPNFANPATSANSATTWAVGINWWLNNNVRLLTSFSHTSFGGGGGFDPLDSSTHVSPAIVSHQDESVIFTRLQIAF